MRYIGIDPGLDGAVAVLSEVEGVLLPAIHDTPTAVVAGRGKRRVYLPRAMAELVQATFGQGATFAVLERVHAMPKQGVRSMFSMGHGLGLWEGILAALGVSYEMVAPQRWKREMMDGMGKDKDASRVRAMQLFPTCSDDLRRKKDHGRAEALLLAEYGHRTWNGQGATALDGGAGDAVHEARSPTSVSGRRLPPPRLRLSR